MKIDDRSDLNGVSSPAAKNTTGVGGGARHEAGRGVDRGGSDRAELSGLAGKISRATGEEAVERAANVERLRLEVSEGRYRPDPADISRGIVNDALVSAAAAGGTESK